MFPRLWATLADLGYRLHWGKALPLDAAASARHLSRQYPRWSDFLRVRQELDPEGVFLTRYWRAHLGLDVAAELTPPPSAPTSGELAARTRVVEHELPTPLRRDTFLAEPPAQRRRWPFVVHLDAVDADFADTAEQHFEATTSIAAPPSEVFALFRDIPRTGEWFPGFVGCEWRTPDQGVGSVYDETFLFMSVRVRVLEERPPRLWLAAVEAASLPLASRMIMRVQLEPRGGHYAAGVARGLRSAPRRTPAVVGAEATLPGAVPARRRRPGAMVRRARLRRWCGGALMSLPRLSGTALSVVGWATGWGPLRSGVRALAREALGVAHLGALPEHLRVPLPVDPRPLSLRPAPRRWAANSLALPTHGRRALRTVDELHAAFRRGELLPREVAARARAELVRRAQAIHGRVDLCAALVPEDEQEAAAREADASLRVGLARALDGVPVLIKDVLDMRGLPTRMGAPFVVAAAAADATAVARLRASGAVLLGKATMTELGISPLGASGHQRLPHNPHAPGRAAAAPPPARRWPWRWGSCP
jgi:hypothetical protein